MAIMTKSSQAQPINYVSITKEFADAYNASVDVINKLLLGQSTGVMGENGDVIFTVSETPTTLTSNFNTGLGDGTEATLQLENWPLYFSTTKTLVTVLSLASPIVLSGHMGYVYLTDAGTVIITSAPYAKYQPDKVRILRYYKNSLGYYSIIIMPEFASTPKFLRSISQSQRVLNLLDFTLQINEAAPLTFKQVGLRCLAEGAGCMSMLDENLLIFDDADPAILVDEGSDVDYTELDTTGTAGTYITKQLNLSFDGRLIVQAGTTEYSSLEEAVVELPHEFFASVNGDTVGEYVPVVRIAHKANTTDLTNLEEGYMFDLTKAFAAIRTPVWYIK